MRLKQIQAPFSDSPVLLPVTVAEAKQHARVTTSADDAYIEALITTAADYAQQRTGRAIGLQVWEGATDSFPREFELPLPPTVEVLYIEYVDSSGDVQTVDPDTYTVSNFGVYTTVRPNYGESWPVARCERDSVRVRFSCGHDPGGSPPALDLPQRVRQAILVMVAELYDNRSDKVDDLSIEFQGAIDALLRTARVAIW